LFLKDLAENKRILSRTAPAKSLIYKYFTRNSLFPRDMEGIIAKSLIPKGPA